MKGTERGGVFVKEGEKKGVSETNTISAPQQRREEGCFSTEKLPVGKEQKSGGRGGNDARLCSRKNGK